MKRLTLILATVAMAIAPLRPPAMGCILSQVTSERACAPGSCSNKTCCLDAEKNIGIAAQPIVKGNTAGQLLATLPARIVVCVSIPPEGQQASVAASNPLRGHPTPRPAWLCTFLI